jgi:hypothetical protein
MIAMARTSQVRVWIVLAGGLLIWAGHFAFLYATQTAFCTLARQPENAVPLRLLGAVLTAIGLVALLGIWRLLLADSGPATDLPDEAKAGRFLQEIATAAVGVALLAIVWSLIPLLALPPCGAPAA